MAKKKKSCLPKVVAVIILITVIIFAVPFIIEFTDSTSTFGDAVEVVIPQGATGEDIAAALKEKELINSELVFKIKVKLSDKGTKMNYGTFTLYDGMCIDDIISTLAGTYSYKETVRLTIPEGYSVEQIAVRCEELGLCTKAEFLEAANGDFGLNLPASQGVKYKLQGYLYPETYEFYKDATAHEIIERLIAQFQKEMKDANIKSDKSMHEILTIASLIEREALLDSEMRTISGVIYNRLEKGMRLQVDAAVQYAVSDGYYNVNRITYSDLEIDSPYNTYKVDALPAGPICNPGIEAIKAACNPEKHSYLYYHTDTKKNDGSHIFTKTYEEHLQTQ